MKKFIKRIIYRSPEITISLGAMMIYLAASSSDYGMMRGNGSPEWTNAAIIASFALIGIGVFLGRVRREVNRAKNR